MIRHLVVSIFKSGIKIFGCVAEEILNDRK